MSYLGSPASQSKGVEHVGVGEHSDGPQGDAIQRCVASLPGPPPGDAKKSTGRTKRAASDRGSEAGKFRIDSAPLQETRSTSGCGARGRRRERSRGRGPSCAGRDRGDGTAPSTLGGSASRVAPAWNRCRARRLGRSSSAWPRPRRRPRSDRARTSSPEEEAEEQREEVQGEVESENEEAQQEAEEAQRVPRSSWRTLRRKLAEASDWRTRRPRVAREARTGAPGGAAARRGSRKPGK